MYVCLYVCIYAFLHFPFAPQYFPEKYGFPAFSQRGCPKTPSFARCSAKGRRKPKLAKKSQKGESSLGPLFCNTGSPKAMFTGTLSNCRAVWGTPAPLALRPTAGVPIPEENWHPVVDLVPGSIPESPICQYGGLDDGLSLVACVDCASGKAVCKPFYQCTMSRVTVQMT